jgi:hypothetical protein
VRYPEESQVVLGSIMESKFHGKNDGVAVYVPQTILKGTAGKVEKVMPALLF